MIEFKGIRGFREPARILSRLVNEGNTVPETEAVVSYGVPLYGIEVPTLNENAGKWDKWTQGEKMAGAGIPIIRHLTPPDAGQWRGPWPLLGRNRSHSGGRDIVIVSDFYDMRDRRTADVSDFYTVYEPSVREVRCWIYRRRHLASYEKFLSRPGEYRGFGRSYNNGWGMRLLRDGTAPQTVIEISAKAVDILGLDFGAVDLIETPAGNFKVLEVNTAPGFEDDGRASVNALARRIRRWRELGYLRRNGT